VIATIERWRGPRRWAAALIAGALATAALPPFHVVPLLWIAFPLLLTLLGSCRTPRESFAVGWCFGFGHFVTGFSWIANAFYVDAEMFGAFAIPAVGALCAGFAIYAGLVALAVRLVPPANEDAMPDDRTRVLAARAVLFALAWTAAEWVRGWFLTGFPWNPLASVWAAWPAMIQVTALIGTLGLSLLTVLAASLASVLVPPPRFRLALIKASAPIVLLAVIGGGGAVRLSGATVADVPDVTLRLVQPNISQADKWRPGLREQHLMDHIRLSVPDPGTRVTHVIWGEAAVAFALDQDQARRELVAGAVPKGGALITGVTRVARSAGTVDALYNSLLAIDESAKVVAVYDKTHLVPFGEYLPLRRLIPFPKLTAGTMDFSPGELRSSITLPGLPPFGPLICYEAVFSGAVLGGETRPAWLLNLTNDSWFGDSTGPRQHLAQARLRAVEEGLPLVRVANTGISAVIDPFGRINAQIPLGVRGAIDVALPQPAATTPLFGLAGNGPVLLVMLGSGILLIRRNRTARSDSD